MSGAVVSLDARARGAPDADRLDDKTTEQTAGLASRLISFVIDAALINGRRSSVSGDAGIAMLSDA
jgi:hypothetical protein